MPLKLLIDHTRLTDSPYTEEKKTLFNFTKADTNDFVQDMVHGAPTSYLISGYRGTGKSSFIKKLEADVKEIDKQLLFIHLNLAKPEVKSILLRKLIRALHLKIEEDEVLKENKIEEFLITRNNLRELYERTFYNISKNFLEKKEISSSENLKIKFTLKDIFLALSGFFIFITLIVGFNAGTWYPYALSTIASFSFWKYFSVEITRVESRQSSNEVAKSLLYDDELAEHYLTEVLNSIKSHIKPVFVLDELDKIHNDELVESLINELKPIMLSGLAFFIVVSGQSLFYNYFVSKTKDDGALSSLFSKVHHVSLFSSSQLRVHFDNMILHDKSKLLDSDTDLVNAYVNYLIFESKRIPRSFNVLIRQNISWEKERAFLNIDRELEELEIYSNVLKVIEKVDSVEILSKPYPMPIRDYFNMQLLIKSEKIIKSQNLEFDIEEINKSNG